MIGISLSRCVLAMVKDNIDPSQVECIVSATAIGKPEDLEKTLIDYKRTCWAEHPNECERLARLLWNEGKVEQPRLQDDECHPVKGKSIWVDSRADIVWWKDYKAQNPNAQRVFMGQPSA